MADPIPYRVVRDHTGDQDYHRGDVRLARAEDVMHLVPHVLVPQGEISAIEQQTEQQQSDQQQSDQQQKSHGERHVDGLKQELPLSNKAERPAVNKTR